jgi:hypothetical protein
MTEPSDVALSSRRVLRLFVLAAERARNRALDPVLSTKQVQEARRQMEDAAFRRERLQAAMTRLRERLEELGEEEEDERRWVAYDKARTERDKLAAELANVYPGIEQKLRELLPRIAANDREVEYINAHALPSSGERLLEAELVARGLSGFVENGVQIPRITHELRLPAFERSQFAPYAWPRPRLAFEVLSVGAAGLGAARQGRAARAPSGSPCPNFRGRIIEQPT